MFLRSKGRNKKHSFVDFLTRSFLKISVLGMVSKRCPKGHNKLKMSILWVVTRVKILDNCLCLVAILIP